MTDWLVKEIKKKAEITKFLIAGGTATLVNLILLYLLTDFFGWWYLFSSVVAFSAAFFISFYLQKFWAFNDQRKDILPKQMVFYLLLALFNLVINVVLMYFLVEILKLWYMLAQFFTSGLIALWNFMVYKFFIFNIKEPKIFNGKAKY